MKIGLVLVLCILPFTPAFPVASSNKGKCADQYGHCQEWSRAGFCNVKGYKTYMDLMCSYSCSRCPDHIEVTRASGEEKDNGVLGSTSDPQTEEVGSTSDASPEEVNNGSSPPSNAAVSPNEANDDKVDQESYKDVNTPGVRNIVMPKDLPDDINPRSEISKPISQLSSMVQNLKKTIAQTNAANQRAIAELYSSNYVSTENQDDQSVSQGSEEVSPNQDAALGSTGNGEEMKDIAGEVRTGSKIFEEEVAESESTSGCSSGYGCYSEPGDQVKESQEDEEQELESRSKINVPEPKQQVSVNADSKDTREASINHSDDVSGEAKETDIDTATKEKDITTKEDTHDLKHQDKTAKKDIDSSEKDIGTTPKVDIDSPLKNIDKTDKQTDIDAPKDHTDDIDSSPKHEDKTSDIDIQKSKIDETETKSIDHDVDHEKAADKDEDRPKQVPDDIKYQEKTDVADNNSGSGESAPRNTESSAMQNDLVREYENMKDKPSEDTPSGSGKGSDVTITPKVYTDIDKVVKEDEEEDDIDGLKTEHDSKKRHNTEPSVTIHGEDTIDKTAEDNNKKSKPSQVTEEKESGSGAQENEEDSIEDALYEKGNGETSKKTEESPTPNENEENDEDHETESKPKRKNLTSSKNKERLTSIEKLITKGKMKRKPYAETKPNARGGFPKIDNKEADSTYLTNKIGKSHRVSVILDQHYYKPYNNEDSMAYEMLALDLKKEVERAVGSQALVSQIKFSEIKKPGKLPSYSRVLASFRFYGDEKKLHKAVEEGLVGDIMVDKAFYQSS